jgi:hypothetical protein
MKNCNERITEELERVAHTFRRYMENFDVYENGDDEQPPFCEHGLSLDWQEGDDGEEGFLCYLLSWGGPSDELRFYRDGTVEYWFKDWFDGASRDVSREDWAQWLLDMWQEFGLMDQAA